MSILREVLSELFGMFLGDAWLSAATLGVVAVAALVAAAAPLAGGAVLLIGCLAVVLGAVLRSAPRRKS